MANVRELATPSFIKGARRFDGPNLHMPHRCVVAAIVATTIGGGSTTLAPGAARRLHEFLLASVRASRLLLPDPRTVALLDAPVAQPVAAVVAAIAIELQRLNGEAVGRWRLIDDGDDAIVAYEYEIVAIGVPALSVACRLVAAAAEAERVDAALGPPRQVAHFLDLVAKRALDISTRRFVAEAERRGVPWQRINEGAPIDLFIQIGEGCHQRRMIGAISDRTNVLGSLIADSKAYSSDLLRRLGLPAPRNLLADTAEQAVRAAREIGYPVVVKPESGTNAQGVSINLGSDAAVVDAYGIVAQLGRRAVVEEFIPGPSYRMLVVGGRLVATARCDPAHVVGDGHATIRELVERTNLDPRRGAKFLNALSFIKLDETTLALLREAGLDPETVPAAGAKVILRRTANLSTGGTALDVTGAVHPDNLWMAETIAQATGLDIIGIDFLSSDISRPFSEVRCGINEINIRPGLRPHFEREAGEPDVVSVLMDDMMPPDAPATIPLVAVCGGAAADAVAAATGLCLAHAGLHVVVSSGEGITAAGLRLSHAPQRGDRQAADAIVSNPDAEAGVLALAPADVERSGLGLQRTDIAVCLAPARAGTERATLRVVAATAQIAAIVEDGCTEVLARMDPAPANPIVVCHDDDARQRELALGRRVVARHRDEPGLAVLLPSGTTHPIPDAQPRAALVAAAVALALADPRRGPT